MKEIADASNVSRASLFLYFPSKTELVIAISTWKWKEYITWHDSLRTPEEMEKLTGAEWLKIYIYSFLELYRNHKDILRFNYNFNSFLAYQKGTAEQKQPYQKMVDVLGEQFHKLYERGRQDGTLNTDIPEHTMFSSVFHIMLATITRYAVGLAIVNESDPESELVMLADMILEKFTKKKEDFCDLTSKIQKMRKHGKAFENSGNSLESAKNSREWNVKKWENIKLKQLNCKK